MNRTLDPRRAALYAALLRYSPEAHSLRERILDRVVLLGLAEATETKPLRAESVRTSILAAGSDRYLRLEVVRETLERLAHEGFAARAKRRAYHLTTKGLNLIGQVERASNALFEPVLASLLADVHGTFSIVDGERVFRRFVAECFARYGRQIARFTTGKSTADELLDAVNARAVFRNAAGSSLTPEGAELLEAKCISFLKSTAEVDVALKFRLTQGFYAAELLEAEKGRFDPIADHAFRGALLYVDTNVLLPWLVDGATAGLREVLAAAASLGVEVRVSAVTLQELRSVTVGRAADLHFVTERLPQAITAHTHSALLAGFLSAQRQNPSLTVEEFLGRFQDATCRLAEVGIKIDERSAEEIVADRDLSDICHVVNVAAAETRGYGKAAAVQQHDAVHALIVATERQERSSVWFLTSDRTLCVAAKRLAADAGTPFTFPLSGFLQALSPFLTDGPQESALAAMFNATLEDDVRGLTKQVSFDLQELRLIGEFHEDVLSTPTEQVIQALEYVKGAVLNGRPYYEADHARVALGLRKFLSSSESERQHALTTELERREQQLRDEIERREQAERRADEALAREEGERDRHRATRDERTHAYQEIKKSASKGRRDRLILAVVGALLAFVCWRLDGALAASLVGEARQDWGRLVVRAIGAFVFLGTLVPVSLTLSRPKRSVVVGWAVLIALGGLGLGGDELKLVREYLALTGPIVASIMVFASRSESA